MTTTRTIAALAVVLCASAAIAKAQPVQLADHELDAVTAGQSLVIIVTPRLVGVEPRAIALELDPGASLERLTERLGLSEVANVDELLESLDFPDSAAVLERAERGKEKLRGAAKKTAKLLNKFTRLVEAGKEQKAEKFATKLGKLAKADKASTMMIPKGGGYVEAAQTVKVTVPGKLAEHVQKSVVVSPAAPSPTIPTANGQQPVDQTERGSDSFSASFEGTDGSFYSPGTSAYKMIN